MPSAWHNFVEPALRAVRPAFDPLEGTGLFKWLRRHVRRIREERGGLPPIEGAPTSVSLQQLQPVFDLQKSAGSWRATGVDPQLVADCRIRRGWSRLQLDLSSDIPAFVELYIDTGRGFNPRERFELSDISREVRLNGFIRLDKRVRRVRLDPLNHRGTVTLRDFRIEHISVFSIIITSFIAWRRRTVREQHSAIGYIVSRVVSGDGISLIREILSEIIVARASESVAYAQWRARTALTHSRRRALKRRIAQLANPPLISFIVPVYNAPIKYLRRCIESVRAQLYPHWELCLADDASPYPAVRRELEHYAKLDPRIKVVYRKTNGNISAASNSALDLATGDYVALLDNDDEIEPHALAFAALVIDADPSVDVLYSDEDKVDVAGRHFDPFFKPDWSPEYFLSGMYICHLGIYRRSLVERVGRFRSQYDGAQDYDLALRITALTDHVRHIPDVLYHWRTLPTSTAASTSAKPKAYEAARSALERSMRERGISATVTHGESLGYYRVKFHVRGAPRVSIVVPLPEEQLSAQRHVLMLRCLSRLLQTSYANLEVVAVGTVDPLVDGLRFVHAGDAKSWAERANLGARSTSGDVLVFLSPFVETQTLDWVTELLSFVQQPAVGAVGAKVLDRNGWLSHVGLVVADGVVRQPYLGFPGYFPGYNCTNLIVRNWSAVRGVCLATRRDVFESVGGFNPADGEQADVGYCLRLRAQGLRIAWTPHARFIDYDRAGEVESVTTPSVRARFKTLLPADPFYNRNLVSQPPLFRVESRPASVLA